MTNRKEAGKSRIGTILLVGIVIVIAIMVIKNNADSDNLKAIQSVLKQDKDLHDMINNRMSDQKPQTDEDYQRVSGYYDDFVAELSRIDTSQCPRDFADAYHQYTMAFTDLAGEFRAHPHTPSEVEGFVEGFKAGLDGNPMGEVQAIEGAQATWREKLREKANRAAEAQQAMKAIATRYGAI